MHVIRSHSPAHRTGSLVALELASVIPAGAERGIQSRTVAKLSPREVECLEWLARGLLDDRIGERIGISCSTVRLHLKNARAKLGAKTREQALVIAVQRSLIQP